MSPSIGQEFMRLTRTAIQPEPPQALGVSQPPLELPYDETQPLIALPDPHTVQPVDGSLLDLIEQRSSVRRYATQPLSLAELSYLLWCTQGVKPLKLPDRTLRTVPSAGARHPFETLSLVNRVDGLEPGLYRFIASKHSLIALRPAGGVAQGRLCARAAIVDNPRSDRGSSLSERLPHAVGWDRSGFPGQTGVAAEKFP